MNELGALLRDVRRQSGDPVAVVILAVAVRYCIVPVVGDGTFGEVCASYPQLSSMLFTGGRTMKHPEFAKTG